MVLSIQRDQGFIVSLTQVTIVNTKNPNEFWKLWTLFNESQIIIDLGQGVYSPK